MLHITNGDSVAQSLRASGMAGEVVPWRDVLHEGPVPAGLDLAALSEQRARFIAAAGWGDYADVLAGFRARDAMLEGSSTHDEVVLWFEHDLYDQLQLIQVLDWLAGHDVGAARLSLICVSDFPVTPRFVGLGQLTPDQLVGIFPTRHTIAPAELALGAAAWAALRAPDPTALIALLAGDTSALPYLAPALTRLLEEYPGVGDGLARTDRQILELVAAGNDTPAPLFKAAQDMEQAPYMGDLTFWGHIQTLCAGPHPALARVDGGAFALADAYADGAAFQAQALAVTENGRALLAGASDWAALAGLDRWIGGVHLRGQAPAWRWDRGARRLVARGI